MSNLQTASDKTAIGLSLLCAIHCLAFPLAVVLLPSLAALPLNDEAFHIWMLVAVIPTSIYALTMGCKKHKHFRLLALGFVGISCLIAAVVVGEALHSEIFEKTFTTLGAGVIAFGHFRNYRLCQETNHASRQGKDACDCPAPSDL